MRAIEFRAWDIVKEKMIPSVNLIFDGGSVIGVLVNFYGIREALEHPSSEGSDDAYVYLNKDFILMQHTGLQDAKGNKIFEGDILKSHMGDLVVMFTNGKFIAEMKNKQSGKWDYHIEGNAFYQVDIVGNIYEGINEQKTENIGTDRDGKIGG